MREIFVPALFRQRAHIFHNENLALANKHSHTHISMSSELRIQARKSDAWSETMCVCVLRVQIKLDTFYACVCVDVGGFLLNYTKYLLNFSAGSVRLFFDSQPHHRSFFFLRRSQRFFEWQSKEIVPVFTVLNIFFSLFAQIWPHTFFSTVLAVAADAHC